MHSQILCLVTQSNNQTIQIDVHIRIIENICHELTFKRIELNVPATTKMFTNIDGMLQAKARLQQ